VMCSTSMIQPEDLLDYILQRDLPEISGRVPFHNAVMEFKRQLIVRTVQNAKFVYVDAAKSLGIHPNNLHRLIRQLNLKDKLTELEQASTLT
jgi:transcriptional regulator with GAF, ATPase, and Fis domain